MVGTVSAVLVLLTIPYQYTCRPIIDDLRLVGRGPTYASTGSHLFHAYTKVVLNCSVNAVMNDMIYCFGKFAGISEAFHFITEKLKVAKRCSLSVTCCSVHHVYDSIFIARSNTQLRVVKATIAFGMRVDC